MQKIRKITIKHFKYIKHIKISIKTYHKKLFLNLILINIHPR